MKTRTIVCTIMTIISFISMAFAAPQKVNFQGKLTDTSGNPINGNVSMAFSIYEAVSGSTALWTETQPVTVTNGIYNVLLGGYNNPIDTELTESKALWLGVKVGSDAEMSPRMELTPGVYDLIMLNTMSIENGNVSVGALTFGPWPPDPGSYVFLGTNTLDQTNNRNYALLQQSTGRTYLNSPEEISFRIGNSQKMILANNGNVGIGTTATPSKFQVRRDEETTDTFATFTMNNTDRGIVFENHGRHTGGNMPFIAMIQNHPETTNPALVLIQNGTGPIFQAWDYYNAVQFQINKNGDTTIYGTLHVTGGGDFAEPFDMTDHATIEIGDVVVMDPANPKYLTKSMSAYDHKVAGIVSSTEQAGYVAGSRSDGSSDKPVALTGRVLCKVSTENGTIAVGDLLTTSNTPGYAMKATDREKAFGAVLGKALEAFDGDTGMILVLVALQ